MPDDAEPALRSPSRLRKLASLLGLVVAIGGLGYYLHLRGIELRQLTELSRGPLAALFGITLFRFYLAALVNQVLLAELGAPTGGLESLSLTSVANALHLFLPLHGGTAFRAVYLKRRYRLAYSHFLSTVLGSQLVLLLATCGSSAACLVALGAGFDGPTGWALVLCAGVFCGSAALIFAPQLPRRGRRLWDKLAMLSEGGHTLRSRRGAMAKAFALSAALRACDSLAFWLGCAAAGLDVSFAGAAAATGVASLAAYVRLTPGALGTYEVLLGLVSQAALLAPQEAVLVSLICRTANYAVAAVLGPLGLWWLSVRGGLRQSQATQT